MATDSPSSSVSASARSASSSSSSSSLVVKRQTLESLGFAALTPHAHLLARPDATTTILVCAWLSAPLRPVVAYLLHHAATYSSCHILLLASTAKSMLFTSYTGQQRALLPAVTHSTVAGSRRFFVHAFSNGGANTFVQFAHAWRGTTGRLMPVFGLVLDSAPGEGTLARSTKPLLHLLRRWNVVARWFGSAAVWFGIVLAWTVNRLMGGVDLVEFVRRGLNDATLFEGRAVRAYVFSREDEMVDFKAVERHATQARERGWTSVEMWRSVGTGHVAHLKGDAERYWGLLERTWGDGGLEKVMAREKIEDEKVVLAEMQVVEPRVQGASGGELEKAKVEKEKVEDVEEVLKEARVEEVCEAKPEVGSDSESQKVKVERAKVEKAKVEKKVEKEKAEDVVEDVKEVLEEAQVEEVCGAKPEAGSDGESDGVLVEKKDAEGSQSSGEHVEEIKEDTSTPTLPPAHDSPIEPSNADPDPDHNTKTKPEIEGSVVELVEKPAEVAAIAEESVESQQKPDEKIENPPVEVAVELTAAPVEAAATDLAAAPVEEQQPDEEKHEEQVEENNKSAEPLSEKLEDSVVDVEADGKPEPASSSPNGAPDKAKDEEVRAQAQA